ncbi:peptide deformylase, mitochondrial [Nematolebias whitei]|uniref:peptide deformylase, mitochondrial n=1 Tax=Nematolebias whitei TaxID=451745 RepID=UPI001896B163|nr:peptide deformylase, mitochondrial [Nematolebias whitei]
MNTKSSVSLLQLSWTGFRLCAFPRPGPRALDLTIASTLLPHSSACRRSLSSNLKARSYFKYMKRKIISPPSPPYSHACQVGDPILRSQAAPVDPGAVMTPEIQQVMSSMRKVMRKLDCMGLSAPQIGVPLRILMLEYPVKMFEEILPAVREAQGLSVQPLRIFVNPELKVLDSQMVLFQEACLSISGFSATVPRYQSVEVSGLNEKGEAVKWQASGWTARILQHEMDHLNGILYIDRMDSKTFINIHWQEHNE